MKKLKRIESARNHPPASALSPPPSRSSAAPVPTSPAAPRPISFEVQPKPQQSQAETPVAEAPKLEAPKLETPKLETPKLETPKLETPKLETHAAIVPPHQPQPSQPPKPQAPKDASVSWQLAPIRNSSETNPGEIYLSLPRVVTSGFTTHRNAANPALATNLLKEIEVLVSGWQVELQQILKQIQDIYLEGAIVDGWLESYSQEELDSPTLRHAEVDCLMDYVEKTWGDGTGSIEPTPPTPNPSGYRLCGLNEDGQLWFRHCPPEQVPVVSLAIARYQKLKLLLVRKQSLETRLSQLAETLIAMHAELKQD
jgi:hypothetical protein